MKGINASRYVSFGKIRNMVLKYRKKRMDIVHIRGTHWVNPTL